MVFGNSPDWALNSNSCSRCCVGNNPFLSSIKDLWGVQPLFYSMLLISENTTFVLKGSYENKSEQGVCEAKKTFFNKYSEMFSHKQYLKKNWSLLKCINLLLILLQYYLDTFVNEFSCSYYWLSETIARFMRP